MSNNLLKTIYNGETLDAEKTEELFCAIFKGQVNEIELSALLMTMKTRGETAEEITGAARSMRKFSVKPEFNSETAFDTCGTGGDNSHSFNISTAVAIILNAMGYDIAKHGNRSVSSKSGSADFLEALGIPITTTGAECKTYFGKNRFAFMFAPNYHPAMKYAVPIRKTLAVRTIFNYLGPLTNPAGTEKQIIGVFSPEILPLYSKALAELNYERVLLYSGEKGMDEVSPLNPTIIYDVRGSKIEEFRIHPEEFISADEAAQLPKNLNAAENAEVFLKMLNKKEPSPLSKTLALNTALALKVLKNNDDLKANFNETLDVIQSGQVLKKLESLKAS